MLRLFRQNKNTTKHILTDDENYDGSDLMGREATKAYGNVWFEARKNAAKYDDRLSSRDGAAELLGMSVSSVADTELGLLKCMPPDKAVLMADLYNAPHLLNYYCKHECPIGRNRALRCETVSICSSAYRLLQALDSSKVESAKDLLMNSIGDTRAHLR